MEHVVFFPAPDGAPAFRRVPSVDEAVRLVEHLRNVEGVSSVSVHALTEVPLAFRAYYKVELPEAHLPAQATPPPAEGAVVGSVVDVEPRHEAPALALVQDGPAEPPVPSASNGHAATGGLGFFA